MAVGGTNPATVDRQFISLFTRVKHPRWCSISFINDGFRNSFGPKKNPGELVCEVTQVLRGITWDQFDTQPLEPTRVLQPFLVECFHWKP